MTLNNLKTGSGTWKFQSVASLLVDRVPSMACKRYVGERRAVVDSAKRNQWKFAWRRFAGMLVETKLFEIAL